MTPRTRKTHGLSRHPGGTHTAEYTAWMNMRRRCENENAPGFHRYGGRGVKVCDRWMSFANFFEDIGPRPSPQHTLDRVDNSGDYEPSNCRWATRKEQSANRRNTMHINGRPLMEVCNAAGLKPATVWGRILRGWPQERWLEPI
jgi:hypothetical protein